MLQLTKSGDLHVHFQVQSMVGAFPGPLCLHGVQELVCIHVNELVRIYVRQAIQGHVPERVSAFLLAGAALKSRVIKRKGKAGGKKSSSQADSHDFTIITMLIIGNGPTIIN